MTIVLWACLGLVLVLAFGLAAVVVYLLWVIACGVIEIAEQICDDDDGADDYVAPGRGPCTC